MLERPSGPDDSRAKWREGSDAARAMASSTCSGMAATGWYLMGSPSTSACLNSCGDMPARRAHAVTAGACPGLQPWK